MDNLYIFLSIPVLGNLFIFYLCVATKLCNQWNRGRCEANQWLCNEMGMVERGVWLH